MGISFDYSSSGYLDVSVHRVPSVWLCIYHTVTEGCSAGFPHSDISGSMDICSSPKLFAAYHVFHRLLVPRHPPCALYCLISRCIALHHSLKNFSLDLRLYYLGLLISRMSWYVIIQKQVKFHQIRCEMLAFLRLVLKFYLTRTHMSMNRETILRMGTE